MELLARPPGGGSGHGDADGGGTRGGDTRGRGGAWAAELSLQCWRQLAAAAGGGGWRRHCWRQPCGGGAAVAARRRRCSALPQQARPDSTGSLPARPAHSNAPAAPADCWMATVANVGEVVRRRDQLIRRRRSLDHGRRRRLTRVHGRIQQPCSPPALHTPLGLVAGTLGRSAPFFFCDPSRRPFRPLSSPPATKMRRALLDPTTPPASPSPPDPSPRWTAPPSQRASPMGPCGALPTPIRRGPLQPCGLASPPVGGVEVGGLEDGPLSLQEGGGVEGGGVEG